MVWIKQQQQPNTKITAALTHEKVINTLIDWMSSNIPKWITKLLVMYSILHKSASIPPWNLPNNSICILKNSRIFGKYKCYWWAWRIIESLYIYLSRQKIKGRCETFLWIMKYITKALWFNETNNERNKPYDLAPPCNCSVVWTDFKGPELHFF